MFLAYFPCPRCPSIPSDALVDLAKEDIRFLSFFFLFFFFLFLVFFLLLFWIGTCSRKLFPCLPLTFQLCGFTSPGLSCDSYLVYLVSSWTSFVAGAPGPFLDLSSRSRRVDVALPFTAPDWGSCLGSLIFVRLLVSTLSRHIAYRAHHPVSGAALPSNFFFLW